MEKRPGFFKEKEKERLSLLILERFNSNVEKTLKVEILQDETGIYIESLLGGGFFAAIVKEGITQADLTGEI